MSTLFNPDAYRQQKLADFHGVIPDKVWPTPVWQLHQGTDILNYRLADAARGISRAQHRLFGQQARIGDHPDSPGSITTLVVTGVPGLVIDRQIAVFDHMANDHNLRLAGEDEIRNFIRDWWTARVSL
jgi:hypothetical protein